MNKLVLIAGYAGTGKTYIGKILTKAIHNAIFMDKDTLTRYFVENILEKLQASKNDRESETYLKKVRPLEYDTLMKHANENLQLGKTVIACAPFLKELNDEDWISNLSDELEFDDIKLKIIWIKTDLNTMKERILSRAATRDNWKITHWNTYSKGVREDCPVIPQKVFSINNSERSQTSLEKQISEALLFVDS